MTNQLKRTVICKEITKFNLNSDEINSYMPQAGDVAFFEVTKLGMHKHMQMIDGKNHRILPGDVFMATFGNRYAAAKFEGKVPEKIYPEYHILGQGGLVGIINTIHQHYEHKEPTKVRLTGYARNTNMDIINTKYYSKPKIKFGEITLKDTEIILSIEDCSMDSDKITTAGYLSRGYALSGEKVAFIKLTGTVHTKETDFEVDYGAHYTTDFSSLGFPSTYLCSLPELLNLYQGLLAEVHKNCKPNKIIIEIADDLLQRETAMLLHSEKFMRTVNRVIYSYSNSTGILQGLNTLNRLKIKPLALCGSFTVSPILIDEVKSMTDIPVVTLEDLIETKEWMKESNPIENAKRIFMPA